MTLVNLLTILSRILRGAKWLQSIGRVYFLGSVPLTYLLYYLQLTRFLILNNNEIGGLKTYKRVYIEPDKLARLMNKNSGETMLPISPGKKGMRK